MKSQADQIRDFVISNFVTRARARGDAQVEIRAGDVHDAMNLQSRLPNVLQVLTGQKLQTIGGLRLLAQKGPKQGANSVFLFGLSVERSAGPEGARPVRTAPLTKAELRAKRSALVFLMNAIQGLPRNRELVGARVKRMMRENRIPADVAQFMFAILETRNEVDYGKKDLSKRQGAAVIAAWDVVAEWAETRGVDLDRLETEAAE